MDTFACDMVDWFPGGSNTAGLGGFGGPYRLDAGHQVFQVPDWEKAAVPQEVTTGFASVKQVAWVVGGGEEGSRQKLRFFFINGEAYVGMCHDRSQPLGEFKT